MDTARARTFIDGLWDAEIVPQLMDYIRIPNKSPMFDADWVAHGYMDQAVALMEAWARGKAAALDATVEVVRLEGRTPLILIDVPAHGEASGDDCVLLYGHLDKQPEMTGWDEGLDPWTPVLRGDKLYGRGGADDGYAIFGSLAALLALREQDMPYARCVVLIEACEESGSNDLPAYVGHLASRIGKSSLVVCLDSGCGNYEQLWCTTSLRGLAGGNLRVDVLTEGVHSGDASGIVPSSFRLVRQLIDRVEDETTGRVTLDGRPLATVDIVFQPMDGKPPSTSRTDEDGHYELLYKRGVVGAPVGQHTVRIDFTSGIVKNPPTIPAQYNRASGLREEVKPGANEINFDLKSEGK